MDTYNEQTVKIMTKILEADSTFADTSPRRRAEEILNKLSGSDRVELSPSRYGIIREVQGKTFLAVFEKGHNFYPDQVIEELELGSVSE